MGKLSHSGLSSLQICSDGCDSSDYEGRVTKDIRALRKERGLDKDQEWDIWRDGCEGGE
jgi:hypothetical protein